MRLLKPNDIKSLAFECPEAQCGLIMVVKQGKENAATTHCYTCAANGRKQPLVPTQFSDIFPYLEDLSKKGIRFVIPNEED